MPTPDYWGAPAPTQQVCPSSGYFPFPTVSVEFTKRPGDSTDTIERIREKINNQHPEQMSLAADEWQNAYDLLGDIGDRIRAKSQTLHDESWQSAQARDAFMKRGPGATLAALDQWKAAAARNRDALRALVGVANHARADIEKLWAQFVKDADYAQYIHRSDPADWVHGGWARLEQLFGYQSALADYEHQKVQEVHEQYNAQARTLVFKVALAYFEVLNHYGVASQGLGVGSPFQPMNARLVEVGKPPVLPGLPGLPGLPVVPHLPVRPQVALPHGPGGPVVPVVPGVPGVPGMPGAPVVPGLPGVLGKPTIGALGTLGALGVPGIEGLGGLSRLSKSAVERSSAPTGRPGGVGEFGVPAVGLGDVPDPSALRFGAPDELPGGLRSPAAAAGLAEAAKSEAGLRTPARAGGMEPPPSRTPGGAREREKGRGWAAPPGVEEAFSTPQADTAPPVLSAPTTPMSARMRWGAGSADVVGEAPALRAPGSAGVEPPAVSRRRRRERRAAAGQPGLEWLGLDEELLDASAPVLQAPTGYVAEASGLEEVTAPRELRPVAEPIRRRRTERVEEDAVREVAAVVSDEEAWTVPTPGGGVLAGQAEPVRGEEPRATLRVSET